MPLPTETSLDRHVEDASGQLRFPTLPREMFAEHQRRAHEAIDNARIDLSLPSARENVEYVSGYLCSHWFMIGCVPVVVLFPRHGEPCLIVPPFRVGPAQAKSRIIDLISDPNSHSRPDTFSHLMAEEIRRQGWDKSLVMNNVHPKHEKERSRVTAYRDCTRLGQIIQPIACLLAQRGDGGQDTLHEAMAVFARCAEAVVGGVEAFDVDHAIRARRCNRIISVEVKNTPGLYDGMRSQTKIQRLSLEATGDLEADNDRNCKARTRTSLSDVPKR